MGKALKLPKTECCASTTRCVRCPIRMLKDGDLPEGYTVHKRKLVRIDEKGRRRKAKKAKLEVAVKRAQKTQKAQKAQKKASKRSQRRHR